jgi:peptidoglycan/xylan/chitin deacetylase (PgdA/CDA1 family)
MTLRGAQAGCCLLALGVVLGTAGCAHPSTSHSARAATAAKAKAPAVRPPVPRQLTFRYFSGPVYYRHEVVVLMMHDITPHPQPYTDEITPATFQGDLRSLRRDHFNVIPGSLFVSFMEHGASVPPNAVLLTFDNGYQGLYTYGFPLLKRYHVPIMCLLITGWVVHHEPWAMTWSELGRMYDSGLVDMQSQTYNSHQGVQSGPGNTTGSALTDRIYDPATGTYESKAHFRKRIGSDLAEAKRVLEAHFPGDRVNFLSYPFGAYDQTVIRVLRREGYRFAFTTWGGAATPYTNPFQIFRINTGTWRSTPTDLVGATRAAGVAMQAHPRYQSPSRVVPTWH